MASDPPPGRDVAGVAGVVRHWNDEDGWGIVDAPEVAGGCWVHFSAVEMTGYRRLTPGETVRFDCEAADQDGFPFAATAVWRDGEPRTEPAGSSDPSGAYRTTLTITLQDGTVLFGEAAHEYVRRAAGER